MVQLVPYAEEISALHTAVVTLSFGTEYWAKTWLRETGSPFRFLLDPERRAYHAYDLQSSVLRSWMPQNLWYYTKAVLQGRELLGKRGDPHQLGGDFIIDNQGIVRLAHPSRDPTDRPSTARLLRMLAEIERG